MRSTHHFIVTTIICAFLSTLNAETDNALLEKIEGHTSNISTNTDTFWTNYLTNYLKVNPAGIPLTPATPGLNAQLFTTLKTQSDLMATSSTNDTQTVINGTLSNFINISNYIDPAGAFYGITPTNILPINPNPKNAGLNVDSLLAKSAIDGLSSDNKGNEQGLDATNFILLLLGAANPTEVKGLADFDQDTTKYQAHLGYIWALNAQQGVALSNLYHVLRQREIIPGLGTLAGLTNANNSPKPDASILEVEESRILKRIGDPNWYSTMEAASPIELQRESLYVLTEIQRLLHLTRKQNERIMVSFSTLIAQGIDLRKALNQQAEAFAGAGGDNIPIPSADDF